MIEDKHGFPAHAVRHTWSRRRFLQDLAVGGVAIGASSLVAPVRARGPSTSPRWRELHPRRG